MPVADYGESIEWDPSFNPYRLTGAHTNKQENAYSSQASSLDFEDEPPSSQRLPSANLAVVEPPQSVERTYQFHPNHRLQARNINKKKKGRLEDAIYYDEEQLRKMARCLVDALDYLHNLVNIVHRDIKPQNVLLDESGSPMLVDFGKAVALSKATVDLCRENDLTTSIEGTYTFLPPECCSMIDTVTQPYSMKKADVWALGVTLYILTYNKFPFEFSSMTNGHITTELDIMETISKIEVSFPDHERKVSEELKQLLAMMLERDPVKRPDIKSIKYSSKFLHD